MPSPAPAPAVLLCGLLLLLSLPLPAPAEVPVETLRQRFLEAERAIDRGDEAAYRRHLERLQDYPLLPYLEFRRLRRDLGRLDAATVRAFLQRHADTPLAERLRLLWLDRLARRGDWSGYLAFYTPQRSVTRRCHWLRARLERGERATLWPEVRRIWLHGRSRPRACDPVFAAWERAGQRTPELTWQRFELAMRAGQLRLARYLARKLPEAERPAAERWMRLHRAPERAPEALALPPGPRRDAILIHAVERMARRDGRRAMALWQDLKPRAALAPAQVRRIERRIALALERDPSPEAYAWILSVRPDADDRRLQTARLRAALLRRDWPQVLSELEHWPEAARESERGRYWLARALEATGRNEAAREHYRELARSRSYYGFLAADRIDAPYHLAHRDTPADPDRLAALREDPGVRRALELHALDRHADARREWRHATRTLDKPGLKAAARIAEEAGWHDQAIFTLARTGWWDDLELRFPLAHREIVAARAREQSLEDAWIYAVIRQESAFMRDARSHAGALGLMQLMPATARHVARRALGLSGAPRGRLLDPEFNIRLGSAYLRELSERLAGNPVLATAAYNAGPNRVNRWLPEQPLEADIWVELVPFDETRRYLRRVLSYTVIYDKRLGREPRRLRERMRPVIARHELERLAGA